MKYKLKQTLLGASVFAAAVTWLATQDGEHNFFLQRRLDMTYHLEKVEERNISPRATYNLSSKKYELMQTPCRPEADGYFGSTAGKPLDLQYGFELETSTGNTESILEKMQEHIIENVLISSFPDLCGFRRREMKELRHETYTTGFRFGMDLTTIQGTCNPLMDPTNVCSVHSNTISIFGRHLSEVGDSVLLKVIDTLIGMEEKFAKDGLVRLTIQDDLTKEVGDYDKPVYSNPRGLSPGVKTAIALATIALVACLAAILLYITVDRRATRERVPVIHVKSAKHSIRTDRSDEESNFSEVVGFQAGPNVVLDEDGRPAIIEFEHGELDGMQRDCGSYQGSHASSHKSRASNQGSRSTNQGSRATRRSQSGDDQNSTAKRYIQVEQLDVLSNTSDKMSTHFSRPSTTWESGSQNPSHFSRPSDAPGIRQGSDLHSAVQSELASRGAANRSFAPNAGLLAPPTPQPSKATSTIKSKSKKSVSSNLKEDKNKKVPHSSDLRQKFPTQEIEVPSDAPWSDCSYMEVEVESAATPRSKQETDTLWTNSEGEPAVLATVEPDRVSVIDRSLISSKSTGLSSKGTGEPPRLPHVQKGKNRDVI